MLSLLRRDRELIAMPIRWVDKCSQRRLDYAAPTGARSILGGQNHKHLAPPEPDPRQVLNLAPEEPHVYS
jgi:hypothetical protein